MTKQLTLDEMVECLMTLRHPSAHKFQKVIEATANAIAQTLAAELKIRTALAGTCAPFRPAFKGQPCPPALSHYDPDEWAD